VDASSSQETADGDHLFRREENSAAVWANPELSQLKRSRSRESIEERALDGALERCEGHSVPFAKLERDSARARNVDQYRRADAKFARGIASASELMPRRINTATAGPIQFRCRVDQKNVTLCAREIQFRDAERRASECRAASRRDLNSAVVFHLLPLMPLFLFRKTVLSLPVNIGCTGARFASGIYLRQSRRQKTSFKEQRDSHRDSRVGSLSAFISR